ncbi:probable RNA-binding protein EIF1AD [Bacillus rossius redtenbacheri]|uniref:probable RNA-binding protein EIF1AD n=1 Tax=Bacillus rossius redtenbacheri TaxID=93214 RepID=UPI002FDDB267
MSRATKRKHVIKEVLLGDLTLPSGTQQVVRVAASRGNNLHEVETPRGERFLASMPTKFRRNVWIKRGDFVLVEPVPEGDKVKAEMVGILTPEHVRFYKSNRCWPAEFEKAVGEDLFVNTNRQLPRDDFSDGESVREDLFVNTNRQVPRDDFSDGEASSDQESSASDGIHEDENT